MDLQDAALRLFNLELLQMAGMLLRLALDHAFGLLDDAWHESADERARLEAEAMADLKPNAGTSQSGRQAAETTVNDDADVAEDDEEESVVKDSIRKGSFFGFARFMARGVKKRIVSVVSSVNERLDDGSDLLRPPDPRHLMSVERQAIALMQAYCPRQATPDLTVGTALAEGFGRCLQVPPPVLTVTGVVRSDWSRLPHQGLQAFCPENVIRQIVYDNATEYHDYVAQCRKLEVDDLLEYVAQNVFSEDQALKLLQWWRPFYRVSTSAVRRRGSALKDLLRFHPEEDDDSNTVLAMRNWLFYVERDSLLSAQRDSVPLPLPETVMPIIYQDKIGATTLTDASMRDWFEPIPMEIWAEFIAYHECMNAAKPEDTELRLHVLHTLFTEFSRRPLSERNVFGGFLQSILADKPCLPFDPVEVGTGTGTGTPPTRVADIPSELYSFSAELKAFEGIGSFRKVSASLKNVGITEDFLLVLGVRQSVSIDFLFSHLDTLQWSNDPRPLVEYLRQATLTDDDRKKLLQTRYLPAENDSKTYAPSELFLPADELRIFPFLRILQWPTESELSERSENGAFLVRLGMQTTPQLSQLLEYMADSQTNDADRRRCLDYVSSRLRPRGVYYDDYTRLGFAQLKRFQFMPCAIHEPLNKINDRDHKKLMSPVSCYASDGCCVMGFPVVDPSLGDSAKLYGSLFHCAPEPECRVLVRQLLHLVEQGKQMQNLANEPEEHIEMAARIHSCFAAVFNYLSHRSSDFELADLKTLKAQAFIPCRVNENSIVWFKPSGVFFRQDKGRGDALTEELFPLVEFSPFLAATGVKQEATTRELFDLLLESPKAVLQSLGSEKKYRSLLRRIAAHPPFGSVTKSIRSSPFLLAYRAATDSTTNAGEKTGDEKKSSEALTYDLACAEEIYIIDNSFFGRMFGVQRAPHESDLEDFYALLGSRYISKSVERRFEHAGKAGENTPLTMALRDRILERVPLLLSPHVTTRPMVEDAAALLDSPNLDFFQASSLMAVYSLRGVTRRAQTTCFSRKVGRLGSTKIRNAIYVVEGFDWFDVGYAIGDLILQRCQLEDAFFISSLLDAPLEQLRSRGFPVDRILQPTVTVAAANSDVANGGEADAKVANGNAAANGDVAKANVANANVANGDAANEATSGGMDEILTTMFPDADDQFVKSSLGRNPTLDDVQSLANTMAQGDYPKKLSGETMVASTAAADGASTSANNSSGAAATAASAAAATATTSATKDKKKRGGLRGKLGKALGGLRGSSSGGAAPTVPPLAPPPADVPPIPSGTAGALGPQVAPHNTVRQPQQQQPQQATSTTEAASPASDMHSQASLERMLQQHVSQSARVNTSAIHSPDTLLTSVPTELDRGESCEVIDGKNLRVFTEYRNGTTTSGIRIFASQRDPSSAEFLAQQTSAVEAFGTVLAQLAQRVYELPLHSIAIFYESTGNTIAFNLGRSIYYNLRFFYALHFQGGATPPSAACYSYWYMTTAHELSHNLVSAHNKEHGFYTESYATLYLPKLAALAIYNK
jgi:hypothetical protein